MLLLLALFWLLLLLALLFPTPLFFRFEGKGGVGDSNGGVCSFSDAARSNTFRFLV